VGTRTVADVGMKEGLGCLTVKAVTESSPIKRNNMKYTALLILLLLLGCSEKESAKVDQSDSGNSSNALMSDRAQLPKMYAILRDFPWDSIKPDMAFATVNKTKDGAYFFVSNKLPWVPKDQDSIEMVNGNGENVFLRIAPNVDARSFIEGYIGCNLYFSGVVSLDHFYSIESPSSFRLVLLMHNSETFEHIIETETFFFSNQDETNSVQVEAEFRFPQHTSIFDFQDKLHQYSQQYIGVCKQVELLYQGSNALTRVIVPK